MFLKVPPFYQHQVFGGSIRNGGKARGDNDRRPGKRFSHGNIPFEPVRGVAPQRANGSMKGYQTVALTSPLAPL